MTELRQDARAGNRQAHTAMFYERHGLLVGYVDELKARVCIVYIVRVFAGRSVKQQLVLQNP